MTHLDHLRAMHRYLFPERYGLDEYGFPCEPGYVHEWDSGTIEVVAAAIERALVDDGSTEIDEQERTRYRAELRREAQS